ncbi:MAG: DMT family transporter [Jatrophihabitantaceae bacterium]
MALSGEPRWPFALAGLALVWGTSYLFIKIGLEALSPSMVAFGRVAIGAVTLLAIVRLRRTPLPRGRLVWLHLAVAAGLVATPFLLFGYAEEQLSSALVGLLSGASPLVTALVVFLAFSDEHLTSIGLCGLLLGFVGVLTTLDAWTGFGGASRPALFACLGAVACYGTFFPYTRRFLAQRSESPVALAAGQMVCATVLLAPALLLPGARSGPITARVVMAMLLLGALGSGIGYILNLVVTTAAGATTASTVSYLIPVVAVIAGVLVLGEPITWNQPVGGVVVLAGVAMSQFGRATRHRRRSPCMTST